MMFSIKNKTIAVNVSNCTDLLKRISTHFAKNEGFSVATINLDHLVKLEKSAPFRSAYCAQTYVVADGNPIVWLAKLANRPVELTPGSELVLPIAKLAAEKGVSVALFGSTKSNLDRAADSLMKNVPGLSVVACIAPKFGFLPDGQEAVDYLKKIEVSGAGLCFLALGAPKQEIFAALGNIETPSIGFVSVGAGIDFMAGSQKRAPLWVQKLALEWLWRTLLNPVRMAPRYAQCMAILPKHFFKALQLRNRADT